MKDPNILAHYVGLLDIDSGTFLYSKNKDTQIPIASVTKIMTATVVVDNYNLNDIIDISKESAATTGSVMQLKFGEKITTNSLLYGLLIPSGNDAAYTLAEYYGK